MDMAKMFTAAEAARETGASRTTIMRKLNANEFPQAIKGKDGWRIPLEDLLAAGLNPGRTPPDHEPVREHDQVEDVQVLRLSHEVELLRVQLAAAQQIAAEKDRVIETQAQALRALEAPQNWKVPAPESAQTTPPPPQSTTRPTLRSGLRGLLGF